MMHTKWIRSISFIGIIVAIGCGGKPEPVSAGTSSEETPQRIVLAQAVPSAGGATLAGKVSFEGTPPAPARLKMDADPVCKEQHSQPVHSQEVVTSGGGLQYVFVYVKSGLSGTHAAPTQPVVFDQKACIYDPHVVGIQVGQPLQVLNSDATLHNVNCKPKGSTPFNLAMPTKGMKVTKTFAKPELGIPVKCNVHPWMQGYINVVDHPFYAVSSVDGSFTITGLPAGTYTLEAWHEKLGTSTQEVTLADGDTKAVNFTFKAA